MSNKRSLGNRPVINDSDFDEVISLSSNSQGPWVMALDREYRKNAVDKDTLEGWHEHSLSNQKIIGLIS